MMSSPIQGASPGSQLQHSQPVGVHVTVSATVLQLPASPTLDRPPQPVSDCTVKLYPELIQAISTLKLTVLDEEEFQTVGVERVPAQPCQSGLDFSSIRHPFEVGHGQRLRINWAPRRVPHRLEARIGSGSGGVAWQQLDMIGNTY